jgi:hypothetical protein
MGNWRASHAAAQFNVERQPQPVADNRGMYRRQPVGQCLCRCAIGNVTDLKIFEKRSTNDLMP